MARYAKIENGTVVNVAVGSAEWAAAAPGTWVEATGSVSKGWTWDGQDFSPPEPEKRTVGTWREFQDLFTDDELDGILAAAEQSAPLKRWIWKGSGGDIDLENADLITQMAGLVSAGLLTSDRRDEILAADFDTV